MENVFETNSSCEFFKVLQELAFDVVNVCHRCRYKFEPLRNHADLVVSKLENFFFLMNFSLFCLLVAIRLKAKFVLRCLRLLFALRPFIFSTPLAVGFSEKTKSAFAELHLQRSSHYILQKR